MRIEIPLFDGLPQESVDRLLERAVSRSYPKNAVLIHEGDEPTSLYFILSGRVKVFLTDVGGKEFVLTTQGEGEYFGELSLLDDAPRSASVAAVEPAQFLVLSKAAFQACLAENPDLALQLIRGLARRVRKLTENARTLALKDVFGRITSLLTSLAGNVDGQLVVGERLTHQEIASRIGSSREMVSRILKDLETGGYISVDSQHHIALRKKLPQSW